MKIISHLEKVAIGLKDLYHQYITGFIKLINIQQPGDHSVEKVW